MAPRHGRSLPSDAGVRPVSLGRLLEGGRYGRQIARPAIAVAVLAALVAPAVGCGDHPSPTEERAEQVGDAAAEAGLPDEVADFLADAARGADGTFRIVYEIADPAGGDPQRVTVTQRPPDRRLDVERPDGTADATIATGRQNYQCTSAAGSWRCDRLTTTSEPEGLFSEEAVAALVEALTAGAADYDFSVETRVLLGVQARCLVTSRRAGAGAEADSALGEAATLCLSPQGARLLTEVPTGTLRAVEYTTEISSDAFELPADPS